MQSVYTLRDALPSIIPPNLVKRFRTERKRSATRVYLQAVVFCSVIRW